MTKEQKIKAVIFDIDGTLTPEISWLSLTRDLGTSVEKHLHLYHSHRDGKITYETSKQELLKLWQETGKAKRNFLEKLFMSWPLKNGALEIINYLKSKNYTLCLLTGAVDLYAEAMAKRLGISYYLSNAQFIWDKDENLVDFHYEVKQREKKLKQFLAFCQEQNLDPKDCVVVGDGYNDADLFAATGNGIAVKSADSHHLEKIAWKNIENLEEIKNIL